MLYNNACAQLIHSLVTGRLDYCNSILYGLPDNSLYRLHAIQNTAAIILARLPMKCFKYAGPQDWNNLPIHIRKSSSLSIFLNSTENVFISVDISQ